MLPRILILLASVAVGAGCSPAPRAAPSRAEAMPPGDAEVVERFHRLYYDSLDTWHTSKWLGVITLQNPNDVWIHQEILFEVQPDFVIETGTAAGGSALIWAMVLEQVNPRGKVLTVDLADHVAVIEDLARSRHIPAYAAPGFVAESVKAIEQARRLPIWKERVEFIQGSSTDPRIVARIGERVKGHKTLVILDSLHTRDHVLAEMKAYGPMVSVGSYMIVQDTNINGHPVNKEHGPGPMEAVEEFLAASTDFVADRTRERLLFTMHPKGYLKRVR